MKDRSEQARERRQRRRALLVLAMLVASGLVVGGAAYRRSAGSGPEAKTTSMPSGAEASATAAESSPTVSVPITGPGTFSYASVTSPVLGTSGSLKKFRIAVEKGIGVKPDDFAEAVDRILGDPRSWTASGKLRLQQVPGDASGTSFTIYLASAATTEKMCLKDGLHTDKYTSCRLSSGKVVINLSRWLTGVSDYGAPLEAYQAYAINHEVGHQLGYGHEGCPGTGKPAPVMQQQTLGLKSCVANAWPYLDGQRYSGPPIP